MWHVFFVFVLFVYVYWCFVWLLVLYYNVLGYWSIPNLWTHETKSLGELKVKGLEWYIFILYTSSQASLLTGGLFNSWNYAEQNSFGLISKMMQWQLILISFTCACQCFFFYFKEVATSSVLVFPLLFCRECFSYQQTAALWADFKTDRDNQVRLKEH